MKDKIYMDSNFLVALFFAEHDLHAKAKLIFSKLKNDTEAYISFLTLDEVVYVVYKYGYSLQQAAEMVRERIEAMQSLAIVNPITNFTSVSEYFDIVSSSSLKPRDAMHLLCMRQNEISVIATLDGDFIKNKKKLGIKIL